MDSKWNRFGPYRVVVNSCIDAHMHQSGIGKFKVMRRQSVDQFGHDVLVLICIACCAIDRNSSWFIVIKFASCVHKTIKMPNCIERNRRYNLEIIRHHKIIVRRSEKRTESK